MEKSVLEKKIYYHDTDCGGVVYYANYLKYFEEARTEYFAKKGIVLNELSAAGTFFVVAGLEIKYKSPARYGDKLLIATHIEKIKAASMYFYQEIKRNEALLVQCQTKVVCVDRDFIPKPIPSLVSSIL
ncbi:MAG: YbgC/FadM family acyl-CoA thioesterase [Candidatus Omnitrophica bacterium]|nr:YbgC/FadM family acyl-CoA thioesterase [Candidatus Omnitrophota bacterium]